LDTMPFDAAEFLDNKIFCSFHFKMMMLCGLVQFLEGFDALILAYTAPALTHAWHIRRASLGPVFAASLAGMALGTIILSPLADWIGRKKLVIIAVFIFGSLTLVASQAQTLGELRILRFFMGFGLAAAVPSTVVLVNEFAPRKHRASMVMGMSVGVAIGAASGGQLTTVLLPMFGWQGAFVVGGVAPLLLIPVLLFRLPESVRFLTVQGGQSKKIIKILHEIEPNLIFPENVEFSLHQRVQKTGLRVAELFSHDRLALTLLLWFAFFISLIVINFLNNWLPTVFAGSGLPTAQALRITTLFQLGGIIGIVAMGFLCDRFGYHLVLIGAFVLGATFIALIGWNTTSVPFLVMAVPMVGLCTLGANNALTALAASIYPTAIRATGTSLAHAVGRFGGIAGPVIGGMLLSMDWSIQKVFSVGAIFPICGVFIISAMKLARSNTARDAEKFDRR
jgi:MFS transporter, AAHS family, 4-hydroxybenzoate transporter